MTSQRKQRAATPAGRFIEIDGRIQFLVEQGEGSPCVVFESGCGGSSGNWDAIRDEVSSQTRTVSYDRAGCGKSDRGTAPRDCLSIVEELHLLLASSGNPPPYVLVGLSFGGMVVRLFASLYPEEVAGMVLVEPAHERLGEAMPRALWNYERQLMVELKGILGDEVGALDESSEQVRELVRPLRDTPLVVITGCNKWHDLPPEISRREVNDCWLELHADLAGQSSRGEHWLSPDSGHHVQDDDPRLVISAIRKVVSDVRAMRQFVS